MNYRLDILATRRLHAHVCYVTADIMHRCDHIHAGLPRRVIHNGIDPLDRAGRPRPQGLEPGLFHAGIVGRVSEVKGIVHALRALTSDRVPTQVRLDVIGTGPLLDALQDEARALGVADRVRFHGFQRDILDWIAHLDALLMPSLHEGLPYTLLEAMSLGVPVIASRVGGLAEVLEQERTALLVEVGDAAGLADALARLAGDPGLGRRLGEAAALEQREHYTLARMVDDYLEVYAAAAAAR
jgi:glycosyltransferase involved in cell wall biosynthesis